MSDSTAARVARLQKMTVSELRVEWEKVFGEPTQQRHRVYLWKRLARAVQGDTGPYLAPDEEARVEEYRARIRQLPPDQWFPGKRRSPSKRRPRMDRRTPPPGSVITREYKGEEIAVSVLSDGFEYAGRVYRSLSAIAREITGTAWNGFTFFKLTGGRR